MVAFVFVMKVTDMPKLATLAFSFYMSVI